MVGHIERRGGARPNSGPKNSLAIGANARSALIQAAKKKAKEAGKTPADVLLDWAYSENPKHALIALKIFMDCVVPRQSEVEKTVTERRAPIALPERRQDPAKVALLKANG